MRSTYVDDSALQYRSSHGTYRVEDAKTWETLKFLLSMIAHLLVRIINPDTLRYHPVAFFIADQSSGLNSSLKKLSWRSPILSLSEPKATFQNHVWPSSSNCKTLCWPASICIKLFRTCLKIFCEFTCQVTDLVSAKRFCPFALSALARRSSIIWLRLN